MVDFKLTPRAIEQILDGELDFCKDPEQLKRYIETEIVIKKISSGYDISLTNNKGEIFKAKTKENLYCGDTITLEGLKCLVEISLK